MKNTIKKIALAFTSAVLLALPTAGSMTSNAEAKADARYTFREVYYAEPTAGITSVAINYSYSRMGVSSPHLTTLNRNPGLTTACSARQLFFNCQGSTIKNIKPIKGPFFSISAFANTPTSLKNVTSSATGYIDRTFVENSIVDFGPFLVGDINNDKTINNIDFNIMITGLYSYYITNADFKTSVRIEGVSYPIYKFDIDGNGVVNINDKTMLTNYLSGNLQKFAK